MASNTIDTGHKDREMILADFQALTGIEDIADAINLLELNNWDLASAVNGVIQENGILDPIANHGIYGPQNQSSGILLNNSSREASQPTQYGPHIQSNGILQNNFSREASQSTLYGSHRHSETSEVTRGVAATVSSTDSEGEGDDFDDPSVFRADESDMFRLRKKPMMPEHSENEDEALLHFSAEFSTRYGEVHPRFYIGSLESASREAFSKKNRDRKLLAIYLHNDDSVQSNIYCSQVMCAKSIVSYLNQNFITWAWDLTTESNKARLLTMCARNFGNAIPQTIRMFKKDHFPLLLIIMGKRTSNEVLNLVQGNTSVDELMMSLMAAKEVLTAHQQDEDEREAREMVKREQDEAYRLSLDADRKKREEQEREEAEKVRLGQERKEQEDKKEAIRLSLEHALLPEPIEEQGEPISKLRIRTPIGEFLERRFLGSCKLQALFDFVASKGYPFQEFKLLTTYPRRNITQLDPGSTLVEAKLFPQETLFLEAKE